LQLAYRLPMEYVPDPRVVIEDEKDGLRYEREQAQIVKRKEDERVNKEAQRLAKKAELAEKRRR
jgi:hypothetical protein